MKIINKEAISDAGETGKFVLPGTTVKVFQPAIKLISINLPDGSKHMFTHTCDLDIDGTPKQAKLAHMVSGLEYAYLISISILCDAGFRVQYDDSICSFYYNKKLVWKVGREPHKRSWNLPLQDYNNTIPTTAERNTEHQSNNAYTMTSK